MKTIIWGSNHNNTLGLVWSLGEAGHEVSLLLRNNGNNYVGKSKYVSNLYYINKGDDVISLIKRVASTMDSKPVVFVTNDVDATFLNDHYDDLYEYCFFEGRLTDGNINRYRNKDEEETLARQCGFSIPKTVVVCRPEEINNLKLNLPLFIKGNNSIHGGKSAMKKCDTLADADTFAKSLPQDYYPLQVQEFVEKEYEIMLLGCSLYRGEKVYCPIANKKIRQYPKNVGLGAYSESVEIEGNTDLKSLAGCVTRYMKAIEYTGNFSVEFLYSHRFFFS